MDADKVGDVYLEMDKALGGLIQLEILNCASEGKAVENDGVDHYCRNVINRQSTIGQDIDEALENITKY